jgi:hypothetical protein
MFTNHNNENIYRIAYKVFLIIVNNTNTLVKSLVYIQNSISSGEKCCSISIIMQLSHKM